MYFVYILASRKNGSLYVGITNDLVRRVDEQKSNLVAGFTKRYGVHYPVYHENACDVAAATQLEKRIKKWNRAWRIELIEQMNPEWRDPHAEID